MVCTGTNGELVGVVLMERPIYYRPPGRKQTIEEMHLERFMGDYRRGMGVDLFPTYFDGPDPPDFVVGEDNDTGFEITQFVVEERVAAHARFRAVRTAVMAVVLTASETCAATSCT